MGRQLQTYLGEEDHSALRHVLKKSTDWHARERAQTLLLLSQPLLCREVAHLQEIDIDTVRATLKRWTEEGMQCLYDKPRCGAPRKMDEMAAKRLVQWDKRSP